MISDLVKEVPARVKRFVRENWGAPFIVGFMLLLLIAAASLSMSWATMADEVAVYAYYALVVGIILQLVCYPKNNKMNGAKDNEQG
jgi:membrane protein YdbS with pleckstrin-like domain